MAHRPCSCRRKTSNSDFSREPLATTFAAQFADGGTFSAGTSYLVWRDPKVPQGAFSCPAKGGSVPTWYPLGQEGFTIFDEQEHAVVPFFCPFAGTLPASVLPSQCPPSFALIPFPAATQRVVRATRQRTGPKWQTRESLSFPTRRSGQ